MGASMFFTAAMIRVFRSTMWPKGTDHCNSKEYWCAHVGACVARTWISYRRVSCHPWCTYRTSLVVKKSFQFSCGCEQFHYGEPFGFLVINICNHWEHYETPCIREIEEDFYKQTTCFSFQRYLRQNKLHAKSARDRWHVIF
jgi:hypothetical protein